VPLKRKHAIRRSRPQRDARLRRGDGAALLCAGSCFHSQAGKTSTLFTGTELECARAWVEGVRSVPLEFQAGTYQHLANLEGPDCIRAYSRRLPDGREHVIRIRP
jgi:hypothetical protein